MQVNQTELARIIGVSSPTLRAWERDGMPAVAKAGPGLPATYETADVIRWIVARGGYRLNGDHHD